jgi:hypothetical protein
MANSSPGSSIVVVGVGVVVVSAGVVNTVGSVVGVVVIVSVGARVSFVVVAQDVINTTPNVRMEAIVM